MSETSNRPSSLSPALEGLDREQQDILTALEDKRQKYGPLERAANQAVARQMRVYHEIKDLESRLATILEAREILK